MVARLLRWISPFGVGASLRLLVAVGILSATGCSLSLGLDSLDSDHGGAAGSAIGGAAQNGVGGADSLGQGGSAIGGNGGASGGGMSNGGAAGVAGSPEMGGSSGSGGKSGASGSGGKGGAGLGGSAGGSAGSSGSFGGQGGAAGTSAVITLATKQKTPLGITVDDLHVYWVNVAPAAIYRVPKTGGTPEPLVTSIDLNDPRDVLVDGATLYWSEWAGNLIRQRALAGGTPKTFVTGAGRVGSLAMNSGIVYATDDRTDQPGDGTVIVVQSGASGAQVLFSLEPLATGMAAVGNTLAWARNGSIALGTIAGGPSMTLVGQPSSVKVSGVALDDSDVYWLEDDQRIKMANRASGDVSVFYDPSGPLGRGDVAVDANFVYWSEPDTGMIRKRSK